MEDKNKIGRFVSYHNIIKPIEYPLLCCPLCSGLSLWSYVIFFFLSPSKYPLERVTCIVCLALSFGSFFLGVKIRKKYLNLFGVEPGKSMYSAEFFQYACIAVLAFSFIFYCMLLTKTDMNVFIISGAIFLIMIVSGLMTSIVVRIRIKKDMYNGRKCIDSRIVAFFASGTFIVILMIIKNIMIGAAKANGPYIIFLIGFICVEISTILSVIYYLKLKYAKKYGLEEYLPERPNPSPYTSWK